MARIMHRLIAIGEAGGGVAIGLIASIVVYDVLARAAGYPTLWALEVSGYLMVAASVLAAGEAMQKGGHFEVRMFVDMLPPAVRKNVDRLVSVVTAGFVIAITIGCIQLALQTSALGFKSPTLLQIPLVIPQSVLCTGLVLLSIAAVMRVIGQWQERENGASAEGAS